MVECYRQRKYNEDISYIDNLGGNFFNNQLSFIGAHGLLEKLKTSLEHGLTPLDFEERNAIYGNNMKAPPKRTPYWRLFLGALDDFMLKFLLVCAAVEMAIEVGFAEADERKTGTSHFY
jgi:magnesium-transporting ATPase (P-type)